MKQAKAAVLHHPTGEPKRQRRPLKAHDVRLSAEAKTLLESLAPDRRPHDWTSCQRGIEARRLCVSLANFT